LQGKGLLNFLVVSFLFAFFDTINYKKGEEFFKKGNFLKAAKEFEKIDSLEGKYNLANALYKAKRFNEAKRLFNEVASRAKGELKFKALHNLGNSLANLGKIKEAIKAYEDALKIRFDKDTKYNLELLKKLLKEKEKKKNKNKKRKNKNQQKKKNSDKKRRDKQGKDKKKNYKSKSKGNKKSYFTPLERKYIKSIQKEGKILILPIGKLKQKEENPW